MLEDNSASVTYMPCHVVAKSFPSTIKELDNYDIVLLSDIGADTLQITDQVADGVADVDRCKVLAEWVREGGSLGMIGGYMSLAGKGGQARYHSTPIGEVLPVEIQAGDDRIETPAGATPHPTDILMNDIPDEWPYVLGYNRLVATESSETWATVNDDPFLVVDDIDNGSSFAYATDCAPHWASEEFLEWEYFPKLWQHIIERVV